MRNNGDNGKLGLQCEVNKTFFKASKFPLARTSALRPDPQTKIVFVYDGRNFLHRFNGFLSVGTIDEQMTGEPINLTKERDVCKRFFGNSTTADRADAHGDQRVKIARVVVEIDGWSRWLQVLFAQNIQLGSRKTNQKRSNDLTVSVSHSNSNASPRKKEKHKQTVGRHGDGKDEKTQSKSK